MDRKSDVSEQNASSERSSSDNVNDEITVHDKSGRRQFMRRGAAYVTAAGVAGGLLTTSGAAYADDCDQNSSTNKNAQTPNTDSDAGAAADAEGCGREPEKPKISRRPESIGSEKRAPVGKINV